MEQMGWISWFEILPRTAMCESCSVNQIGQRCPPRMMEWYGKFAISRTFPSGPQSWYTYMQKMCVCISIYIYTHTYRHIVVCIYIYTCIYVYFIYTIHMIVNIVLMIMILVNINSHDGNNDRFERMIMITLLIQHKNYTMLPP